jgi:muramidase (phage lysozyme)
MSATPLTITDQDRQLLDLIASVESSFDTAGGGYFAINSSIRRLNTNPQLVAMTIQQVIDYTTQVRDQTSGSGAAGRYQFIPITLTEVVNRGNIQRNLIFSPAMQDYLAIQRARQARKYGQWLAGTLSDEDFAIELAKEWAGLPVVREVIRNGRRVLRGQSYYVGIQGNNTRMSPDYFLQRLADIKNGGTGATITRNSEPALSPTGFLPTTQAEIAAGGGQRIRGGVPSSGPIPAGQLPAASDPYLYVPIAAENNRYDFRTGKKVTDILVNGTNPLSNSGIPGPSDIGRDPFTPEQAAAVTSNRITVGYDTGQVDPAIARAAGLIPGPQTPQPRPQTPQSNSVTTSGPRTLPTAPDARAGTTT